MASLVVNGLTSLSNKHLLYMKRSITRLSLHPVFNKEQKCACVYARVLGKLVEKKSTKHLHFSPALLTNDSYRTTQTSIV